jgi:hypothetical protein
MMAVSQLATSSSSEDVPMFQIIDKVLAIPVPFNMIIVIMAIIFSTGIITSIAKQVRKYACLRHELEFKREMIDRGMTPDEVEKLVKCKTPSQLSDVS